MAIKKKKSVKTATTSKKSVTKNKVAAKKTAVKKPIITKTKAAVKKTKTITKKKVLVKIAPNKKLVKKLVPIKKVASKKIIKKPIAATKKSAVKTLAKTSIRLANSATKNKIVKSKKISKKNAAPKKNTIKAKVILKAKVSNAAASLTIKKKTIAKKVLIKKITPKVSTKLIAAKTLAKVELKPTVKPVIAKPIVTGNEKVFKVVKAKRLIIPVEPVPVIEVSNFPKHKIKTILISQPNPDSEKNPYYDLANKYNLDETFRQFIRIEGLPVKDFRAQRIDILEHKAVILTSRMAVDHYFRMCNEMRVTVPESMKYFCINEATAYYLQKYIQYRKRKIFFGRQTIQDLVDVIRKNREEKFLLPSADVNKEKICEFLDIINIKYTKAVMYRTVSADLSDIKNLNAFDCLAFFTPAGIKSLKHNFPNFKQGNTRIACFGVATVNELKKHGYRIDIYAPNPKNPSMTGALDEYMKESNKR